MASRAPNPFAGHWIEIGLGAAALALVAAAFVPTPAEAGLFGKKKPKEDFSVQRAPIVPIVAPVVANGAIFQASTGYAAIR